MSSESEPDDEEYVFDPEARRADLLQYAAERFRRLSGRRSKAPQWHAYMADRMARAYPRLRSGRRFRRLPMPVRAHFNIQSVQGLIDNGGVQYFFECDLPPGGRYGECVRDFRLIGSEACAAGLQEIYRLFPGGSPPRQAEFRWPLLQRALEEHGDTFERVSRIFFENSTANYHKAATRLLRAPSLLRPAKIRLDPKDPDIHYRPL